MKAALSFWTVMTGLTAGMLYAEVRETRSPTLLVCLALLLPLYAAHAIKHYRKYTK